MKKNIAYTLSVVLLVLTACYDDIGNYDYSEVEDPIVTGIDEDDVFVAYAGDSLIVEPKIKHSLAGTDALTYEWELINHIDMRGEFFRGPSMRMYFNLRPALYTVKFTITNHTNGMKYFYKFKVEGRTEFSKGMLVLSNDQGISRLSFIKGTDTLIANIYERFNGENLPHDPKNLVIVNTYFGVTYQVLTGEENKPGVVIDAASMKMTKYLEDNFFETPKPVKGISLETNTQFSVSNGVFNGKLYCGTWQTWAGSSLYGVFGAPAAGDYEMAPYFNFYGSHYLGYDVNKKQFIQFAINLLYQGAAYQVIPMGDPALTFDPKNMNVDLLYMKNLNAQAAYAFGKDENGVIYEYKFQDVPNLFFPIHKRQFPAANLVRENTKWQGSIFEVIYFTSDDKVYRYNPVNQEVRALDADFGGKPVTMIKLVSEDLLIAGVEGGIYHLDVSTGKNGNVQHTIKDIPGSPVDVVIKK